MYIKLLIYKLLLITIINIGYNLFQKELTIYSKSN